MGEREHFAVWSGYGRLMFGGGFEPVPPHLVPKDYVDTLESRFAGVHFSRFHVEPPHWEFHIFYRTLLLLFGAYPSVMLLRFCRYHLDVSRRRIERGLCPVCAYDLRASRERCPECGTPIPANLDKPSSSGAVISNGTISLGINTEGDLNHTGVGLRYAGSGNDGIHPGCECEGWGAADATSGVAGYADRDQGVSNLTPVRFSATGGTATSVVNVGTMLQVAHEYYPSGNSYLYAARVTIRNISDSSVNLRYRRVSDFDVPPTEFYEFMTIAGGSDLLLYTNNNGFAPANFLSSTTEGFASDSVLHSGTFDTAGPFDHGSLFDLGFAEVSAGQSIAFMLYYGAATTRAAAVAALSEVGAEAYALAQPSTGEATVDDSVNTFMIGLASAAPLAQNVELVAHRTGGRFAQAVSEAVESSNDPAKLLILTNNDAEEPAAITNGRLDFDDTSASIPTGSLNPVDDDLMRITLKRIPSALTGGTLGIELSNPSAVRLFTSDGTPLTNLTLSLSIPSSNSYLNGVHARDVDVWVEGLQPDQDFVFSWVHRDSTGRELSRDKVHMTIAEWTFVSADGRMNDGVANIAKTTLLDAAAGVNDAQVQDREVFKLVIDGLDSSAIQNLRFTSDENPVDYFEETVSSTATGLESSRSAVMYFGADSDDLLSTSERDAIRTALNMNAVHNQTTRVVATTQSGDIQQRPQVLNERQTLLRALQDARNDNEGTGYWGPSGLALLFDALKATAQDTRLAVKFATPAELGDATAKFTWNSVTGNPKVLISRNAEPLTVVHELIHANAYFGGWIGEEWVDEGVAWGAQLAITQAQMFLKSIEGIEAGPNGEQARARWELVWRLGFMGIYDTEVIEGTGRKVLPEHLWTLNAKFKSPTQDVRFSAGQLRPIYEALLAANGVTEEGGGRVYLPDLTPQTIPVGNPFE